MYVIYILFTQPLVAIYHNMNVKIINTSVLYLKTQICSPIFGQTLLCNHFP